MTTDPRIVLASKAIRSQLHTRNEVTMAEHALAAADAVMFSEEAVERIARVLWIKDPDATTGFWGNLVETECDYYREIARAVVAALRGDPS